MNKSYTKLEWQHLKRIKSMPCIVCGQAAPSEAHHVRQDSAYYCIPVCVSCHRHESNGIHGRKGMWKIHKIDELDALAKLIEEIANS